MTRWAGILQQRGVPGSVEEIIARAVQFVSEEIRSDMPWLPGARELLIGLSQAGISCALVTNNASQNADLVARAASELVGMPMFGAVVSACDVTNAKPHPEPYLRAAQELGVDPSDSIAVEDSAAGAASAHRAGLMVWFVTAHTPDPGVPTGRMFSSLNEVSAEAMRQTLGR